MYNLAQTFANEAVDVVVFVGNFESLIFAVAMARRARDLTCTNTRN